MGNNSAAVQLLPDKGADPNTGDNNGYTAIHKAAVSGHTHVVKLLLQGGANPPAQTNNRYTALEIAAELEDILFRLIKYRQRR